MRAPQHHHPALRPAGLERKLVVRSILTLVNGPELRTSASVEVLSRYMTNASPADVALMEVRDPGGKWTQAHVRVGHMIGVRGA